MPCADGSQSREHPQYACDDHDGKHTQNRDSNDRHILSFLVRGTQSPDDLDDLVDGSTDLFLGVLAAQAES